MSYIPRHAVSGHYYGLALLLVVITACAQQKSHSNDKEAWDQLNDPNNFGVPTAVFDQLPTEASLPESALPWSDYYWATQRGGISYRWQIQSYGRSYRDFMYNILGAQAQGLAEQDVARLSPSEKYDILSGRDDFPLTRAERDNVRRSISGYDIPSWYGLCHGWAPAAYMEKQPGPSASLTAPNGKRVTFYTSDIKALLSKVYGDFSANARFVGGRCDSNILRYDWFGRTNTDACRDTNPGSFHLVTVDYIARRQKSFVADVDGGPQIWNQPVSGYRYRYSNFRSVGRWDRMRANSRAPGTVYLVDVDFTLIYVSEVMPQATPVRAVQSSARYQYTLELDSERRIIGGQWLSQARPDFLWEPAAKPTGIVSGIDTKVVRRLLAQSRGESESAEDSLPSAQIMALRVSPEVLDIGANTAANIRVDALDANGLVIPSTFTFQTNGGTIDLNGRYMSPAEAGTYTIAVRENSTGIMRSIPVTVRGNNNTDDLYRIVRLQAYPNSINMVAGDIVSLQVRALNRNGTAVMGNFAYTAAYGTTDNSGRYRAPMNATHDTITVREIYSGISLAIPVTIRPVVAPNEGNGNTGVGPTPSFNAAMRLTVWDTALSSQTTIEAQLLTAASNNYIVTLYGMFNGTRRSLAQATVRGGEVFRLQGRWANQRPSELSISVTDMAGNVIATELRHY